DARVIVLRTIEDDSPALERIRIVRIRQIAIAETLRDHARFHDRRIEQVAAQNREARLLLERLVERTNDGRLENRGIATVLADRAAIHRERVLRDQALLHELAHDRRDTTRPIVVL